MAAIAPTSREAFDRIAAELPHRERIVLETLRARGPMTSGELLDVLNVTDPNWARPRLTALKDKGLIEQVDRRPCRVRGTAMIVWAANTVDDSPVDADGNGLLFALGTAPRVSEWARG